MDDYQNTPSADPAAEAEGYDVILNKDNPRNKPFHDASHPGHKAAREYVGSLFSRAAPATITLGGELPSHLSEEAILGVNPAKANPLAPVSPQNQPPLQAGQQPVKFSEAWEYTQEQAQEALKREWPYWHSENMAEIQNPENFGLVFGDFIKTESDKRFLGELFQMIGHHPAGPKLYLHLIKLVKGSRP